MTSLSREVILQACGAPSLERGKAYQRQGRVKIKDWLELNETLVTEVQGSRQAPYQQKIRLDIRTSGISIFGSCNCPVGWNCKHVAAALLEFLDRTGSDSASDEDPLSEWQSHLEAQTRRHSLPTASDDASADNALLFVLKPIIHSHRTCLQVEAGNARRLKRGGYGKLRPIPMASHYELPYSVGHADRRLISLIISNRRHYRGDDLEGSMGASLLAELIATGRCHLESPENPPLQPAPPRHLTQHWETDQDGETRLRLTLEDLEEQWTCVPCDPPWYIDSQAQRAGPVISDLPTRTLNMLRQMPPVPRERLQSFSNFLFRTLPEATVAPPLAPSLEDVRCAPVPVLTLMAEESEFGEKIRFMRIEFDYGGFRLPLCPEEEAPPPAIFSREGREYAVRRHPAEEHARLRELPEAPLVHAARLGAGDRHHHDLTLDDNRANAQVRFWLEVLGRWLPALEEQGWRVEIDSDFDLSIVEAEHWHSEVVESGNDWFELGFEVEAGGRRISLLPVIASWLEANRIESLATADFPEELMVDLEAGQYLKIPSAVLKPVLTTLVELYDRSPLQKNGRLKLGKQQAARLSALESSLGDEIELTWSGGEKIRQLGQKLTNFAGVQALPPPGGLDATLRPYQQTGLNWMGFIREHGFGGILADDMGLGKTLQTLSHLLLEKEAGRLTRPALVIAPTSVVGNWRREAARFAPALKTLLLHGPRRHEHFDAVGDHDLVITTYPLLPRDGKKLSAHAFHCVILDEAQNIKNPRAKAAEAARALAADHRFCLTGTPMENHLGELWSLFHFLMPGVLGEEDRFRRLFRTPIEKHGRTERQQELVRRIAPFMLRRTKQEVATELPPKSEIVQSVALGQKQQVLYESIRAAMETKIRRLLGEKGLARSHIEVLDALLKLRQVCCDPRLVNLESARKVHESAKLELLMEMLPEMLEEGRRILVFSQFVGMLALIEERLKTAEIDYTKLTGRTRKRDEAIERFQQGHVPVFLISLKAGGVGLNLTAADTVIHYDPWWNPAAEQQATDRAYRIGQDKPVFVYKLIGEGTVEERIIALQQRKQALADAVYGEKGGELPTLTAEEVIDLFKPL